MRTLERDKVSFSGVVNTGTAADPIWEEQTITYEAGKTYNINGRDYAGASMIQSYYSNYCNNAYNFIEKVNWMRLRALNVSYDFSSLFKKQSFIKGLVATASANNLWVWTNYVGGLDPEAAAAGSGTGGSGSVGIEYCGVPSQRTFSFGLNLTF